MILPSDSDPPPDRNDSDNPSEEPDDDTNWWAEADDETDPDLLGLPSDLNALPDDLDDPNAPELQSVAGPGWRNDLYKDLIESLRDLEAIEDPDDDFSPPEPPDLYSFFGELAALRQEFRHESQRTQQALVKLAQTHTAPAPPNSPRRKGKVGSESPVTLEAWPVETCHALIKTWDLLAQDAATLVFETAFQPLLQAANLTKILTIGKPFDPTTMIRLNTVSASSKVASGTVIQELSAGFLRAGILLRPAGVITEDRADR